MNIRNLIFLLIGLILVPHYAAAASACGRLRYKYYSSEVSLDGEIGAIGGLSKHDVYAVTQSNMNQIRHCYESTLDNIPTAVGRMEFVFQISAPGLVTGSKVKSNDGLPSSTEACIFGKVARWKFPRSRNGRSTEFSFPLLFTPKPSKRLEGDTALPSGLSVCKNGCRDNPSSVQVTGGLTTAEVVQVVDKKLEQVRTCFSKFAYPISKVKMFFIIGPTGGVHVVKGQEESESNYTLDLCIGSEIAKWVFPPPRDEKKVDVLYTFKFTPN